MGDVATELLIGYAVIVGLIIEATYQRLKCFEQAKHRVKEIKLTMIAILVVSSFYPYTIFTWTPFKPALPLFAQVWTAFLLARTANGLHNGFDALVEFFKAGSFRVGGKLYQEDESEKAWKNEY